jgi:hypothetical protein
VGEVLTGLVIALITLSVFARNLAEVRDLTSKVGTMAFPVIVISRLLTAL